MKASKGGSGIASRTGASYCAGKPSIGSTVNTVYPFMNGISRSV
jgi:hypothetical protein